MRGNKLIDCFFAVVVSCFALSGSVYAQSSVIRNEDGTTLIPSEGGTSPVSAVDRAGRIIVSPPSTGSTTEVTPIPQVTIIPTAIPTAWPTPQFANSAPLSSLTIRNGFDQNVWCDYGVATPAPFTVPAGSTYTSNFASRGRKMSSSVRCLRPAATPAAGTLEIWGEK